MSDPEPGESAREDVSLETRGDGGANGKRIELEQREAALVDPAVSRAKFERELRSYRTQEEEYRKRGWFLVESAFPDVFVLMAAPGINPPPIIYGLELNFLDYDLRPPSLRFVHPLTRTSLSENQVRPLLKRTEVQQTRTDFGNMDSRVAQQPGDGPNSAAEARGQIAATSLVQGHGDNPAFLCVPGTREYHEHPYHTNDPWLAYRGGGAGTLHYLLDIVWRHGTRPLVGWQVQFNVGPKLDPRRIP